MHSEGVTLINLRLYYENDKKEKVPLEEKEHFLLNLDNPPGKHPLKPLINEKLTLWVEGLLATPKDEPAKLIYMHTHETDDPTSEEFILHKDEIHFLISKVDLDVDSDNDDEIEFDDQEEDDIENPKRKKDIKKYPGKIISVNVDEVEFDPENPDFVFVPIKLRLAGNGNIKRNNVKFLFECSDKFRFWKAEDESLDPNTKYSGGEVPEDLYIEALPGAEELKDALITVKVYSTDEEAYENTEWVLDDTVRVVVASKVDLKIRHYVSDFENGLLNEEKWDDNISDAVVEDIIRFRNDDGAKQPPMKCKWNLANEKTVFGEIVNYAFSPRKALLNRWGRKIDLEGIINKKVVGTDTGIVKLHEIWSVACSDDDYPFSKVGAVLWETYLINYTKGKGISVFANIGQRNMYVYLGHTQLKPWVANKIRNGQWTSEGKPRTYKFVMYLACRTANNKNWMKAFAAKTFIGMKHDCLTGHIIAFDNIFWGKIHANKRTTCWEAFLTAYMETVNDEEIRQEYKDMHMKMAVPKLFGNKQLTFMRKF